MSSAKASATFPIDHGGRRQQAKDSFHVGLGVAHFRCTKEPHVREPILDRTSVARMQADALFGVERDHEVATPVEGHAAVTAARPEHSPADLAQCCPERSGRVLQAGVEHTAVPFCLVPGQRWLLLENDKVRPGNPQEELPCYCQTDDPADSSCGLRHAR